MMKKYCAFCYMMALACASFAFLGCGQQKPAPADSTKAATAPANTAEPKPAGGPEATANNLVDLLAKGDFAGVTGLFDATMKGALPEPALRQTMAGLTQKVGAFKSRSTGRTATEQGYTVVYVPCQFERGTLTAKVVMNGSGQVAGLFFQ